MVEGVSYLKYKGQKFFDGDRVILYFRNGKKEAVTLQSIYKRTFFAGGKIYWCEQLKKIVFQKNK